MELTWTHIIWCTAARASTDAFAGCKPEISDADVSAAFLAQYVLRFEVPVKYPSGVTGIDAVEYVNECFLDERIVALEYPMVPDGLEQVSLTLLKDDEQVQVLVDDLFERQDVRGTSRHQLVVKYFGSPKEKLFRRKLELGDTLDGVFLGTFCVDSTVDRAG